MAPRATGTPLARMHASEEGRLGGEKLYSRAFFSCACNNRDLPELLSLCLLRKIIHPSLSTPARRHTNAEKNRRH